MRRRTWKLSIILGGAAAVSPLVLAGCMIGPVPLETSSPVPSVIVPSVPPPPATVREVAILAPLSGPNAERGDALVKAAQLALAAPGSPRLDVRDTGGTPQGAMTAAEAAIAAGDGIIIGPLTAGETAAAAGPAIAAHVPVLAFTTDVAQQRPGVWTLGITPGQQTRRVVQAVMAQGKTRFAALLPDTDFGHAMGAALSQAVSEADIRFHTTGVPDMQQSLKDLSQYDQRVVQAPAAAQAEPEPGIPTQAGGAPQQAQAPPALSGPPPFDALLLADTGDRLVALSGLFTSMGIAPPAVRVLGPILWADPGNRTGATLDGAWFAAPDPASRVGFVEAYAARYGAGVPGLADLAFDAASIARATAGAGYAESAITAPQGFPGADGLVALEPDGQVRRALAVFEIHGGNATIRDPAPTSLATSGT